MTNAAYAFRKGDPVEWYATQAGKWLKGSVAVDCDLDDTKVLVERGRDWSQAYCRREHVRADPSRQRWSHP